jgi:plasmid stability protein
MKTTLDLPDDLMRAGRIRAVEENRRLEDTVTEILKRGLANCPAKVAPGRRRLRLPLVECAHEARPGEELTPDRVARVVLDEEARQP